MDIVEKIRVCVVDDHQQMRQCLSMIVNAAADMEVAGSASNGALAVDMAKETCPDVVLMDICMPVMDGIEASRKILEWNRNIRIILVSASFSGCILSQFDDIPIKGFIQKARAGSELLEAVRAVMRGEQFFGKGITAGVSKAAV